MNLFNQLTKIWHFLSGIVMFLVTKLRKTLTPAQSTQISRKKAHMIISKSQQQNKDFKAWYNKKSWHTFHSSHYDWWAFPIDQYSGHGQTYMLKQKQIQIMKNSPLFMSILESNAIMVCQAWGYDLKEGQKIKTQNQDQKWHNWPIRLYKMTRSLEIFGLQKQFKNAVKYGHMLIQQGKKFTYNRRDLSKYFQQKYNILFSNKEKNGQLKLQKEKQNEQEINTKQKQIKFF